LPKESGEDNLDEQMESLLDAKEELEAAFEKHQKQST
jgi:hypothetical protein